MFTQGLLAWFATYFLHSALLLGAAWLVARFYINRDVIRSRSTERLWRVALIGALLTSAVQTQLMPRIVLPAAVSNSLGEGSAAEVQPGLFGVLSVSGERASRATRSIAVPVLDRSQWIIAAWALVALTLFARRSLQRRGFLRSLRGRRPLKRDERVRVIGELPPCVARNCGVRLSVSAELASPVVLSQKEICLPERALRELSASSLSSMLAHEFAHVARRDPQWLLFYQVLEAAFFFQPLVFVATRALRADAELASDRKAVESGADALSLADSLAIVAQWGAPPAGALGVLGERESSLMTRVRALLESEGAARRPSKLATGLLVGLVLGLACAGPSVNAPEAEPLDVSESESVALMAKPIEGEMLSMEQPALEAAQLPLNVMICEFISNQELLVEGERYVLPADWKRLEQELKRRATEGGTPAVPPEVSSLKVQVQANEHVDFRNALRLMARCSYAQVWDINFVRADGSSLPVPLPSDLEVMPVIEEEVELQDGFGMEDDEQGSGLITQDPDPEDAGRDVRVSRAASGGLEFRLGPKTVANLAGLVEGLESAHRTYALKFISLEVRGDVDFAEVCTVIDALQSASLEGAFLMFVGTLD